MDDITVRLTNCFKLVFPDLPESQIPTASQSGISAWDSVAAITLANVLEEEFNIQVDFDRLAELDSFDRIRTYLIGELQTA